MKVIFWGEYFWPVIGGAEIMMGHLIEALSRRGIEGHVITSRNSPSLPNYDVWKGTPVHRMNFQEALMGDIRAFAEVRRQVLKLYETIRPDIIHAHTTGPSLFFELQTHAQFKIPRFLTVHAFFSYPPKEDGYLRKYLPAVTCISGVSQRILDMALSLYSTERPPSQVIYNGVKALEPPSGSHPSDQIVLFLGRVSKEKGIDLGIRAFQCLVETHPKARLQIAGAGTEVESLKEMARSLGVDDCIDFLGFIPPEEVGKVIGRSRFLILPSRFDEGLPLVALQAAQFSKPLIAARRGGTPEFVHHGETGLLFEEEDWEALASAMDGLLSDPRRCEALGTRARDLVRERFDFDAMVDHYERIYRRLAPQA